MIIMGSFQSAKVKNSKELYQQEFQDGIEEINKGIYLVFICISSFLSNRDIYLWFILFGYVLLLSITILNRFVVRSKFTYPRLGIKPKSMKFVDNPLQIKLIFILTMLWGVSPFIIKLMSDASHILELFFLSYGIYYFISCFILAFWLGIKRFFLIGILVLIGCFLSNLQPFIELSFSFRLVIPLLIGSGIICCGIFLLIKFQRHYPKTE